MGPVPDRKEILKHFKKCDPIMERVISSLGPFQLKPNKKYFQVLCHSIISQQISIKAAESITKNFHRAFFGKAPTPERVLALSDKTMRSIGLSRQKVSCFRDLAQKFADRSIRPHKLAYQGNEEIIEELTSVRGIGVWTAEMFLIFSLNRLDVLPVQDLGLQQGLKNIYQLEQMPKAKTVREIGARWIPWQTIGTWYSWRSLNAEIVNY